MKTRLFYLMVITMILTTGLLFGQSNLIFWNKLGSDTEIQNSEVGANGVIDGTSVTYESAKYANGINPDNTGNYARFPFEGAFPNWQKKGCVEVWIKAKVDFPPPVVEGGGYLFDIANSTSMPFNLVRGIAGNDGKVYFYHYIDVDSGSGPAVGIISENFSWQNGDLVHMAFSWNRDGINGTSDTMRIYQDGVLKASSTMQFFAEVGGADVKDLYIGVCGTRTQHDQSGNYYVIDNIKIWDYAKIDFSDRCSEASLTQCPPVINLPESPREVKITAGNEVVNLNWEISPTADVSNYRIYRSEESGVQPIEANLIGETTTHTYHDNAVIKYTVYYYIITAVSSNTGLESLPSSEVSAHPGDKQHNLVVTKNKFNPNNNEKMKINFKVKENSSVKIKIFNAKGKLVYEFPELMLPAGDYQKEWGGIDGKLDVVKNGVYTIALYINDELIESKKTIIIK